MNKYYAYTETPQQFPWPTVCVLVGLVFLAYYIGADLLVALRHTNQLPLAAAESQQRRCEICTIGFALAALFFVISVLAMAWGNHG